MREGCGHAEEPSDGDFEACGWPLDDTNAKDDEVGGVALAVAGDGVGGGHVKDNRVVVSGGDESENGDEFDPIRAVGPGIGLLVLLPEMSAKVRERWNEVVLSLIHI
eukprot:TRINITY_DN11536_c0_g1_i2.p2 TRINITY_DN11536_c0_g1~~TRINITY_DN11536_c0_g1_i2.p2  ORF type:complete len:107 (-),score=5.77 TRINITY_DN11536_c0_g1_i2:34-354(-)